MSFAVGGADVHKGIAHPGEHAALIERPLWDAVHQLIADDRANKERRNAVWKVAS